MRTDYFVGLDLGQASEYTALAVLERTALQVLPFNQWAWVYAVRYLQRFQLGTPYEQVLRTLQNLTCRPPLIAATLVMDQTSVGLPVVRMFRQANLHVSLRPVTIVAGQENGYHDGCFSIPKRELASVLQLVLQGRRLKISEQLEHAKTLAAELQNFRIKTTALLDDTNAWREREHDDLVFAVGVAVWFAERHGAPAPEEPAITTGGKISWLDDDHWDWHGGIHY
jgi:hypothetical protein